MVVVELVPVSFYDVRDAGVVREFGLVAKGALLHAAVFLNVEHLLFFFLLRNSFQTALHPGHHLVDLDADSDQTLQELLEREPFLNAVLFRLASDDGVVDLVELVVVGQVGTADLEIIRESQEGVQRQGRAFSVYVQRGVLSLHVNFEDRLELFLVFLEERLDLGLLEILFDFGAVLSVESNFIVIGIDFLWQPDLFMVLHQPILFTL